MRREVHEVFRKLREDLLFEVLGDEVVGAAEADGGAPRPPARRLERKAAHEEAHGPALRPLDEIEKPIIEIRNQSLLYSIAFLVFALPLYVTLVVAWLDRRLEGRSRDDD